MSISKILNSLENSWERDDILLKIKNGLSSEEIVNEFLINNELQVKELNSLLKPDDIELLNQVETLSTCEAKLINKIDDLKNSDLPIIEKRNFLRGIINKILVTTKNKDTHNIEIEFKSPFIDDIFEWNVKGKPKKGYRIIDGKDKLSIEMSSFNKRIKQKKQIRI